MSENKKVSFISDYYSNYFLEPGIGCDKSKLIKAPCPFSRFGSQEDQSHTKTYQNRSVSDPGILKSWNPDPDPV